MGSRVKMSRKEKTVASVKDSSERKWEVNRGDWSVLGIKIGAKKN